MQASPLTADRILHMATEAVRRGEDSLLSALDQLPAAIYVTDPAGFITYYNPACIDFAGRVPTVGRDRWCVTWKLYTEDGAFLPHEQCPMAVAILEKRSVRGVTAVAERPDGSRVNFMPCPTHLRPRRQSSRCREYSDRRNRQPAGRLSQVAGAQVPPPRDLGWRPADGRHIDADGR
jgi:PAS domain-containing protein